MDKRTWWMLGILFVVVLVILLFVLVQTKKINLSAQLEANKLNAEDVKDVKFCGSDCSSLHCFGHVDGESCGNEKDKNYYCNLQVNTPCDPNDLSKGYACGCVKNENNAFLP